MVQCGVYRIENLLNGKFYIGSSTDVVRRWREHRNAAINNPKTHFHHAIARYGEENFRVIVVEECDRDFLRKREQIYLDDLFGNAFCYNQSRLAAGGNLPGFRSGIKRSDESRSRQSLTMRRQYQNGGRFSPTKGRHLTNDQKLCRSVHQRKTKYPNLVNANGEVHTITPSLNQFARDHNLNIGALHLLVIGKRDTHKGWRKHCA